ncbi:putative minor capsid protein [Caldifermentibacillus hisashii]|uniref:putative minor capsid protein n=1 Tax=Caldifermentibacillus hisashii TaxID=996558 RepID=UPI0031B716EC
MRVRPLPKSWLIHEIVYEGYTGEKDDWGKERFEEPIIIKYVRFDDSTVFSRDQMQTKVLAEAIVFVDAKHSTPIPEFKEQSKVTFNNKEYVIQKVVTCYYPNRNAVHHYELEVI